MNDDLLSQAPHLGGVFGARPDVQDRGCVRRERGGRRDGDQEKGALMQINIIHQGDATEILKTLPDGCVHCVVTSPPYYGLRDYGVDGQMGLEPSLPEYLARMVTLFREVRRVLRDCFMRRKYKTRA